MDTLFLLRFHPVFTDSKLIGDGKDGPHFRHRQKDRIRERAPDLSFSDTSGKRKEILQIRGQYKLLGDL
jgi:hypothetical protein